MAEAGDGRKASNVSIDLDEGARRALDRQAQRAGCSAEELATALVVLMLREHALVAPGAARTARQVRT